MLCLYYFGSAAEVNVNHLQKVFKWLGMNGDVDWNDIMEGIVLTSFRHHNFPRSVENKQYSWRQTSHNTPFRPITLRNLLMRARIQDQKVCVTTVM